MRNRQKAVDLTENRKRVPVARRQILRPPLRISQHQKATTTVTTFELFVIKSVRSIFHTENDTLASVVSSRFD